MPKQTFLNLPDEKRQKFIDTAIEEFALNDYQNASITTLVKKMGIAKGSVYQYFENKKDLYYYLIEYIGTKKLDSTGEYMQKTGSDFWKWYKKLSFESIRFDLDHPMFGCFLATVARERNNDEIGNIALKNKKESIRFFQKVLDKQQKKGNISKKADTETAAFILTQISYGLTDIICLEKKIDLRAKAKLGEQVTEASDEDIKQMLKKTMASLQKMI